MGRNIYIDLGANVGDTVERHLSDSPHSQVFAFEPNPRLIGKLRNRFRNASNVAIYEAACWILDGQAKLYLGHDLSSTLIVGKAPTPEHPEFDIFYDDFVPVRTVDFARWLLENFNESDEICVKMDIEGSEYKLLRRLIDTDAIGLIKELRCEWHYDRYPVGKDEHLRIKELTEARIKVVDWH